METARLARENHHNDSHRIALLGHQTCDVGAESGGTDAGKCGMAPTAACACPPPRNAGGDGATIPGVGGANIAADAPMYGIGTAKPAGGTPGCDGTSEGPTRG